MSDVLVESRHCVNKRFQSAMDHRIIACLNRNVCSHQIERGFWLFLGRNHLVRRYSYIFVSKHV